MSDALVSPKRLTGPQLDEELTHHWQTMRTTRANAVASDRVIAGEDTFVLPETFLIAGAEQYVAQIPHPRTVPGRVLQKLVARRPELEIPLGPKGLGITAQRLTTRVEEPLNAICKDTRAGFKWESAAAMVLYHGWAAGVTVLDPADWQKHASDWDDSEARALTEKAQQATDPEEQARHYDAAAQAHRRAATHSRLALDVFRARNLPIRHRAISIHNAAPIFGRDLAVEGLLISQEFSTSWLRRHYDFGDAGVVTPSGGNGQDGEGRDGTTRGTSNGRSLTLIEAWLYDEDGLPYVSYCVKGAQAVEARWKGRGPDYDGKLATIDLKARFGIERLPVAWAWGLGNPAETDPDRRAMGLIEPFMQGWKSVQAKMTAMNVACMWMGFPALIEESDAMAPAAGGLDESAPNVPQVQPMRITEARPGTKLRVLEVQAVSEAVFKAIDLELGANADESPGKSNKDQSGFSQSMAEGFEELAITSVHDALAHLYQSHGSFVLEAGKRMPERGRSKDAPGSGYAPIMVFASTDVPVSDKAGDRHNEPMELDPDLIDETFTTVAHYTKSMSIPEEQQSMEAVARNLKTRRQHLEDTGNTHPEETELELLLESIRSEPGWKQYALKLMAQVQGSEELKEIAKAQDEGLANDAGLPTGANQGVAPQPPAGMPPPGVLPPPVQGAPGVPVGGSVTGGAGPQYGQDALSGVVGGAGMTGPINRVVAAGGALPPNLPQPGVPA